MGEVCNAGNLHITPHPAKTYVNEGLCQILFFCTDEPCQISYADHEGKYQKQQGIMLPRL